MDRHFSLDEKEDVFLNLIKLDHMRRGIRQIKISDVTIDLDENDKRLSISILNRNDNNFLSTVIELVDKILLTANLLWDGKEPLLDMNKDICIYPGISYSSEILSCIHIMSKEYIEYMGTYYRGKLIDTEYYTGVEKLSNLQFKKSKYILKQCRYDENTIIHKNFIIAIKELGRIQLSDTYDIVYKDNKLFLMCTDNNNNWITFTGLNNILINGYNPELGVVIGDRFVPNIEIPHLINGYILLYLQSNFII